jgi:hypothetical protein
MIPCFMLWNILQGDVAHRATRKGAIRGQVKAIQDLDQLGIQVLVLDKADLQPRPL